MWEICANELRPVQSDFGPKPATYRGQWKIPNLQVRAHNHRSVVAGPSQPMAAREFPRYDPGVETARFRKLRAFASLRGEIDTIRPPAGVLSGTQRPLLTGRWLMMPRQRYAFPADEAVTHARETSSVRGLRPVDHLMYHGMIEAFAPPLGQLCVEAKRVCLPGAPLPLRPGISRTSRFWSGPCWSGDC